MTTDKNNSNPEISFNAAKEIEIDKVRKIVEKEIIALLDPYICIEVELSFDFHPPHIIAEEALIHYADSENIL